jgi:hypothetical protein
MCAGAAVSIAYALLVLTQDGAIRSTLHQEFPSYTASHISALASARVESSVIGGVIQAAVWVLMARSNQAGKIWARNISAVLFGLASLSLGLSFAGPVLAALLAGSIVTWLVGLGATIALWLKPSRQYQQAMSKE